MLIVYKGNSGLIMTDYNGKRYCFYKNIPVDVPKEVYDYVIASGAIELKDLCITPLEIEKEIIKDSPKKEEIKETREYHFRKKGKKR